MSQQKLLEKLNKPIDFDRVKKDFFEIWGTISELGLGEIDYIKLSDISDLQADNEVHIALILVGIARVISKTTGPCPEGVEGYWIAACNFIEDMPLSKEERKRYKVTITDEKPE